jgi:hypothetical protein
VYFSISPIDGRHPAIEDGASWIPLMNQYQPTGLFKDYAVLERTHAKPAEEPRPAVSARARLGEAIPVPDLQAPVFVKIDVRPSVVGRVASVLFKSPQLRLIVTYADGKSTSYRYIAGMGQSGFVLAPTVHTTRDFLALRSPNWHAFLGKQMPVSLEIRSDNAEFPAWRKSIGVQFMRLPATPDARIDEILFPFTILPTLDDLPRVADCSVDAVDGRPPAGNLHAKEKLLHIEGWAAISKADAILHDSVSVALVAPDGSAQVFPVAQTHRIDVGAALGNKKLEQTGFSGTVNLLRTTLPADIRIIQRRGRQSFLCETKLRIDQQ